MLKKELKWEDERSNRALVSTDKKKSFQISTFLNNWLIKALIHFGFKILSNRKELKMKCFENKIFLII